MRWGDDQGSSFGGSGAQQHWPVYARGRQQVWAALVLGLWEVADTLVVDVPNIAPEWGPGFGDDWGPWPVGGDVFDRVHVLDLNLDRLSLEFLDLGGFLLVDSAWVPNDTWDYHGTWTFQLRDTGTEPGDRTVRLRVNDGELSREGTLLYQME